MQYLTFIYIDLETFTNKKELNTSKYKFVILISLQPDLVDLSNYDLYQMKYTQSLKYQRILISGCKDIGIGKLEFK